MRDPRLSGNIPHAMREQKETKKPAPSSSRGYHVDVYKGRRERTWGVDDDGMPKPAEQPGGGGKEEGEFDSSKTVRFSRR